MSKGGKVLLLVSSLDIILTLAAIKFAEANEFHPILKSYASYGGWFVGKILLNGFAILGMEAAYRLNERMVERGYVLLIKIYIFAFLFFTAKANYLF